MSLAVAGLCQREKKERRKEEGKRSHNKEKTEWETEIKREEGENVTHTGRLKTDHISPV